MQWRPICPEMKLKNLSYLLLITALFACRRESPPVTPAPAAGDTLAVGAPTVVFYYPGSALTDSLKTTIGNSYYRVMDSLTRHNPAWRQWATTQGYRIVETEARFLTFEVQKGINVRIDLQALASPWGIFVADSGRYPRQVYEPPDMQPQTAPSTAKELSAGKTTTARAKRKPSTPLAPVPVTAETRAREKDSVSWMKRLKGKIRGVFSPPDEFVFESSFTEPAFTGQVSPKKALVFYLENDIFTGTDIWYTNGTTIMWVDRFWQHSPLCYILHPRIGQSTDFYGILFRQNLYTPIHHTWPGIQYNDRPFASFLTLGNFKTSLFREWRMRLTTQFDAGVIGESALGETFQRLIHTSEKQPIGWQYQVRDDLVLQYTLAAEKSVVNAPGHDLVIEAGIQGGTLFNNISGGISYHFSRFDRRYRDLLPDAYRKGRWGGFLPGVQYEFFARAEGINVLYDATLQGGMFNHDSPYTLFERDVERYVFRGSAGLEVSYNGLGLGFAAYIISPEFNPQKVWHKWGRVTLTLSY